MNCGISAATVHFKVKTWTFGGAEHMVIGVALCNFVYTNETIILCTLGSYDI